MTYYVTVTRSMVANENLIDEILQMIFKKRDVEKISSCCSMQNELINFIVKNFLGLGHQQDQQHP